MRVDLPTCRAPVSNRHLLADTLCLMIPVIARSMYAIAAFIPTNLKCEFIIVTDR